jgi:transglutaminase-like putative cysteine protease
VKTLAAAAFLALVPPPAAPPASETVRTYRVQQTAMLGAVPAGARLVKWWVAIPDDDRFQEVLDLTVASAPGEWRIVREPDHGNRFLYVESKAPAAGSLSVKVDFTLRRRSVHLDLDPARVGAIAAADRPLYADELRLDAPHMKVTPQIREMADEACGQETNILLQAQKLLGLVADTADHYSKDPTKPKCGVGDAEDCLSNGGGCCTDLHSLFIALARSRGIPARLQMGYRLKESNEGKDADPGYRCWVEYFAPGYGWVPADIVEADDPKGLGRTRWFTGLTERRLWLNEGREFDLAGRTATERVNTMIIGYAEIDGVPATVLPVGDVPAQLSRTVRYDEVRPAN